MSCNAAKLEELFGVTFNITVVFFNVIQNLIASEYLINGGVGNFTDELHVF
jgi:hypothetical protein